MTNATQRRVAELLQRLQDDQASMMRPLWAVEAVDELRRAGAPDGLLREVHPNVHEPERLAPVVAELLRWLRRGAK